MIRSLRAGIALALVMLATSTPALAHPTTRTAFHPIHTVTVRTPHSVTTCRVIPAQTERLVLRCHTRQIAPPPPPPEPTLPACYWSSVRRYAGFIEAAAIRTHLPAGVIAAVIEVESGGDPSATSYTGAEGLMQVEPYTATGYGFTGNLYDPAYNITVGSAVLADLRDRYAGGNLPLAVAMYNGGPANPVWSYQQAVYSHVC